MSARHFTEPAPRVKPTKPYAEFPLFPHANGCWAKKIRGRLHYFGIWEEPDKALAKYLAEKDDLHAGRHPRPTPGELTVKDLANAFLNHKQALLDSGEITPRTWGEYNEACDLLVSVIGKGRVVADLRPDDFAGLRGHMAKRWGPVRLGNAIQRVRSVFKFADDNDLTERPVKFGQGFQRPSAKVIRLHKAKQGPKLFAAEEVRKLIEGAEVQLRAMLLLAINAGYGITDCGRLPLAALDLDGGWVNFPRPKTGINRRCPLWPETVAAIREALAARPKPKDEAAAGLVFLTGQGRCWAKDDMSSPICWKVAQLMKRLGLRGEKGRGLGFYTLRHTFRTVADETRDQPAVDHVMGHESPHMSSVYRERISDERLRAVADYVRRWLFGAADAK